MTERSLGRIGTLLAAAWAGEMLAVAGIAAPALFAGLPRADAGRVAGRLFAIDGTIALVVGAALLVVAVQLGHRRAERGAGSRFGVELGLVLAALAAAIVGAHVVQPMMAAARGGSGLSSGALHGVSTTLFALRVALVGALAWRCSRAPVPAAPDAAEAPEVPLRPTADASSD